MERTEEEEAFLCHLAKAERGGRVRKNVSAKKDFLVQPIGCFPRTIELLIVAA